MTNTEQTNFQVLMDKYLTENISREEKHQLFLLIRQTKYNALLDEYMKVGFKMSENMHFSEIWQESFDLKLKNKLFEKTAKRKIIYSINRWVAAAVILFVIAGTGYLFYLKKTTKNQQIAWQADVAPGRKGALLTLANGTKIMLDTVKEGIITIQNGLKVIKQNGEITYDGSTTETAYNTASTNRGRQYQVKLSDGTQVWLNAESSIHYPLAFVGKERIVEITGEVYFEVAHNASQPFVVKFEGQQIKVLGTHFNIKAYSNEPVIKTTLLEGSVEITNKTDHVIIKPGQQATFPHNGVGIAVSEADTEEAIAWKNGKFKFRNTELKALMRQIERWYDVNVKYEEGVGDSHFYGGTQMNNNLSEVLKVVELSGIHFKIEGTTIVVYP